MGLLGWGIAWMSIYMKKIDVISVLISSLKQKDKSDKSPHPKMRSLIFNYQCIKHPTRFYCIIIYSIFEGVRMFIYCFIDFMISSLYNEKD